MTEAFSHDFMLLHPGRVNLKVLGTFSGFVSHRFCLLILAAPPLKFTMFQLFICSCRLQNIPLVSARLAGQRLTAGLRWSILLYD